MAILEDRFELCAHGHRVNEPPQGAEGKFILHDVPHFDATIDFGEEMVVAPPLIGALQHLIRKEFALFVLGDP